VTLLPGKSFGENDLLIPAKGFTSHSLCLAFRLREKECFMPQSPAQIFALDDVASRARDLSEWTATIFGYGETAWREYRSAAWYVERLRAEGFSVEEGSAGMPTAFCADWSNGAGPVIGLYAEYDAVPGNCQVASTRREPRSGLGWPGWGRSWRSRRP
jgi:aminobenzoyl-glutamate utilization protein B